jgi:hypothetical protein
MENAPAATPIPARKEHQILLVKGSSSRSLCAKAKLRSVMRMFRDH